MDIGLKTGQLLKHQQLYKLNAGLMRNCTFVVVIQTNWVLVLKMYKYKVAEITENIFLEVSN